LQSGVTHDPISITSSSKRHRTAYRSLKASPVNDLASDALDGIVPACFIGTWIILGISGFIVFYLRRDVAFKRKWYPRYVILAGFHFVTFVTALAVLQSRSFSGLALSVVVLPVVVLITYLNIKFTKFCDKCGATAFDHNWFTPMRFCSKCGTEFAASKPFPDREF
jgi:hypothetical protein